MKEENEGIIYILTNQAMQGIIKIGKTKERLDKRVKELSRASGVPLPFEVFYACFVNDFDLVEKKIHNAFSDHRVNPGKEFFKISPERVYAILELLKIKEVSITNKEILENKEEEEALNKIKKTHGNFNFDLVNIKPGSVLTFTRDKNITCLVLDSKSIEFRGTQTSLTAAAKIILKEIDDSKKYEFLSGALYWEYEGEILDDLRNSILNGE